MGLEDFWFLGNCLDCDDDYGSIVQKIQFAQKRRPVLSPYKGITDLLMKDGLISEDRLLGEVHVPSWVSFAPNKDDLAKIKAKNFIEFMESGGCYSSAEEVKKTIQNKVLPESFCLIGVDHSVSGGAIEAVMQYYTKDLVSLIVLDAHTDAIPLSVMVGAIHYDMETNKNSIYHKEDILLYNRKDSYNASSFLYYLIKDEVINPKNFFILGVNDYPPSRAFKIKDKRIVKYIDAFLSLKKKEVKIFTKKDIRLSFKRVKKVLSKITTPYVYISIDMDVGAVASIEAVRFKNRIGLGEREIWKIVSLLNKVIKANGKRLVGVDLMEFNPRDIEHIQQAYFLGSEILKKLV